MSTKKKPARPGLEKRKIITDAAEALFAESGFDAVSVRNIADAAGLKLSLVTYHFPSKEQLFEQVISRRSEALTLARRDRLNMQRSSEGFDLTRLVDCYTYPLLELIAQDDGGWRHYSHLIAQISQSQRFSDVIANRYDETAHVFVDALIDLFPHADRETAIRALVYLVSVMLGVFSSTGRVETLSEGMFSSDPEAAYQSMLQFIVGGIQTMMQD